MDLESELPPLFFIEHNLILNAGALKMMEVARNTDASPDVISWIQMHGKLALHAAYNEIRDNAS